MCFITGLCIYFRAGIAPWVGVPSWICHCMGCLLQIAQSQYSTPPEEGTSKPHLPILYLENLGRNYHKSESIWQHMVLCAFDISKCNKTWFHFAHHTTPHVTTLNAVDNIYVLHAVNLPNPFTAFQIFGSVLGIGFSTLDSSWQLRTQTQGSVSSFTACPKLAPPAATACTQWVHVENILYPRTTRWSLRSGTC